MIKRIAITGPESTGKSWLAKHLSAHFGEPWVPEFSRAYLNRLSHPYTFNDVLRIARGQYRNEERMAAKADIYLFCDTDFLVTHIWCMVKYGRSHPWIIHMLEKHRYHHYLLCNTDLPWEPDPLREHPEMRQELLGIYIQELQTRNLPYTLISGSGDQRLQAAVKAVRYPDDNKQK